MENINEVLPEEEEVSILTLTDDKGNETNFEYLDSVEHQGVEYLVLCPADQEDMQIVILAVEPVDEEIENYIAVEDEALLNTIYGIFKDRYKDVLQFAEE